MPCPSSAAPYQGTYNSEQGDSAMDITTIGVVGAGAMGNGIAQVCAQAGFAVIMNDREPQ